MNEEEKKENEETMITSGPISEFHEEFIRREKEIEKRWRSRNRRVVARTIVIVVVLIAAFSFANLAITGGVVQDVVTEEDALRELASLEEIKPYTDRPTNIRMLLFEDVKKLAEEAPAIYGEISGSVWQAVFSGETSDVFVLYDSSEKRIVKIFEVTKLSI